MEAKPHPGGGNRLTAAQRKRLSRLLLQGHRKHGYDTDPSTVRRPAEAISPQFGVKYHPSAVCYLLRRMG